MSIPLDKLYHYIESIAQEIYDDNIIIYRFFPHGSKKIEDLKMLKTTYSVVDVATKPQFYCNDQEPLNYEFYKQVIGSTTMSHFVNLLDQYNIFRPERNFIRNTTIYDKCLLLHSEKRSSNLKRYEDNHYIGIYYWSHALIARDWFRYAKHDALKKSITSQFLIYNRAWAGTREYRLKFIDLLISFDLLKDCKTSINIVDPETGEHYTNHSYSNTSWIPKHDLEKYSSPTVAPSSASADYEIDDYNTTEFEVVLETLFDDDRLHLTEKILRPIALGQPFLLAATHGSLEYLRSYGFKTFASVIDESYDTIEDPYLRLEAIAKSMKQITQWTDEERESKMVLINQITAYNRKYFFGDKFNNLVVDELKDNIRRACDTLESTNTSAGFINHRKLCVKHDELKQALLSHYDTRQNIAGIVKKARPYYLRSLSRE